MRRVLIFFLPLSLLWVCTRDRDPDPPDLCYQCTVKSVKTYCDTTIMTMTTEDLKCDWTAADAAAYEAKNTFTLDEKCFFLVQSCRCKKK